MIGCGLTVLPSALSGWAPPGVGARGGAEGGVATCWGASGSYVEATWEVPRYCCNRVTSCARWASSMSTLIERRKESTCSRSSPKRYPELNNVGAC